MAPGRYHEAHISPKGPGDARPTAIQIIEDEGLVGKLSGKVALVTGATGQSIGVETARALHVAGMTVYLGVRDLDRGQKVVDDIMQNADASNKAQVHLIKLSLDSLESVRQAAKDFLSHSQKLNVLVNNAGVMAAPEGRTVDGFETQFGTNHLGHFLLFQLLKPTLLASSTPDFNSRVVSVSSVGHRLGEVRFGDYNFEKEPYEPWLAYGQAKTANIYLANEIDRRYGSKGLHAWSLHPGGIMTGLSRHTDPERIKAWQKDETTRNYFKSVPQGAATSVWAAVAAELEGKGGKFLSNCEVVGPFNGSGPLEVGDDGYAPWAYDEEKEKLLWAESCKMVGVADD
jgi:NAD(P)-dependent dehydrogenase (short-subunit alcohol dehydrogenase family)